VDKEGPMCSKDWPEREVASFLVSSVESVEDWCRRDVRRVWRVEVEAMLGSS
jgi:hypothetical protein